MSFCTNCGSKLKETDRFCSECGSPVKASKPTPHVRQVNESVRKVASPRSIERDETNLSVNDSAIRRGGNITGQAGLNLTNSQKKGMRVLLEVVGEHRWVEWDENSDDMLERDSRFERIYEYRKILDGEKEYTAGSHVYDFQISVPDDIED